jgi:hypothetical protein
MIYSELRVYRGESSSNGDLSAADAQDIALMSSRRRA